MPNISRYVNGIKPKERTAGLVVNSWLKFSDEKLNGLFKMRRPLPTGGP